MHTPTLGPHSVLFAISKLAALSSADNDNFLPAIADMHSTMTEAWREARTHTPDDLPHVAVQAAARKATAAMVDAGHTAVERERNDGDGMWVHKSEETYKLTGAGGSTLQRLCAGLLVAAGCAPEAVAPPNTRYLTPDLQTELSRMLASTLRWPWRRCVAVGSRVSQWMAMTALRYRTTLRAIAFAINSAAAEAAREAPKQTQKRPARARMDQPEACPSSPTYTPMSACAPSPTAAACNTPTKRRRTSPPEEHGHPMCVAHALLSMHNTSR